MLLVLILNYNTNVNISNFNNIIKSMIINMTLMYMKIPHILNKENATVMDEIYINSK